MNIIFILMAEQKSFKQCFSPASIIVGNRLTKTISLQLYPNPMMQFIQTDNMCQVLHGKHSTAYILLNSQSIGTIRLPGISFTYLYNQNITITHTFVSIPLYDQTLDAANGGYEILIDDEYQVQGSVADVMHTRSNQTSCFSQTRFVYDLENNMYGFEVQPVFCSLTSFSVFFEYQINYKWIKIPVRAIQSTNQVHHAGDYSDINTDFLQITRYLLDPTSVTEIAKYSDAERLAAHNMIITLLGDLTIKIRLSLEYYIKSTIGAVTAIADYWNSMDPLSCSSSMDLKATLNEGNIMFKTGFANQLPCLEIPSSNPLYVKAQYLKTSIKFATVQIIVRTIYNTVHKFTRTIPFVEFISLPYVKFNLDETEVRELMDYSNIEESAIQMFISLYDDSQNQLYDFNTNFIPLKRTCIQKRVIHFKPAETVFALWTKQDTRCITRTSKMTTLNYFGKTFNGIIFENRQTYQVNVFVNYSAAVFIVTSDCKKDLILTQTECEQNRRFMMQKDNRKNMYFIVESQQEYNEIRNYAIETTLGTFKWGYVVFGITGAIIVGFVAFGLKQQS
ncbi:Conserved_hypothetical protein [Hexamita inflata]|uniref:Uncharacterized protein n=1 Tax=Hexamita inflata TaxID=28002 RepID=A0ABP1GQN4_9EUKA